MKILFTEYNSTGQSVILPIGDNVLLRNNDDFYLPHFTTSVSCIPQVVVRISRLGKSIGERFAGRYYEEMGMGIRFYADDFSEQLTTAELPNLIATAFDGSTAISSQFPKEEEVEYELRVNGEIVFVQNKTSLAKEVDALVAKASCFHTLKIGDYLYCGNSLFRHRGIKSGDRLQISCNGKEIMDFKIK